MADCPHSSSKDIFKLQLIRWLSAFTLRSPFLNPIKTGEDFRLVPALKTTTANLRPLGLFKPVCGDAAPVQVR